MAFDSLVAGSDFFPRFRCQHEQSEPPYVGCYEEDGRGINRLPKMHALATLL